jgi:hypothetical protein
MLQCSAAGRNAAKSDIMAIMADTPDFAALAREYLDLWEDQLAAMAADPTLARQSARFFETMGGAEAAANPMANPMATAQMAAMAQQFMTLAGLAAGGNTSDGPTTSTPPNPAPGAAPAAAASGDGAQQLAELTGRLAALEERLDRLEAGGGGAGSRAKPATGKRGGAKKKGGAKRKTSKSKKK